MAEQLEEPVEERNQEADQRGHVDAVQRLDELRRGGVVARLIRTAVIEKRVKVRIRAGDAREKAGKKKRL